MMGLGHAATGGQGWVGTGKGMDWTCPTHSAAQPTTQEAPHR